MIVFREARFWAFVRCSSSTPRQAAMANEAVAMARVWGSEAMAEAVLASQTFVRMRGSWGLWRSRKCLAISFWEGGIFDDVGSWACRLEVYMRAWWRMEG